LRIELFGLRDHTKQLIVGDRLRERLSSLTSREHEVLGHVVAGRLNKQIAGALGIVEQTVKVHRARMMGKMKVRTVADLARLAEKAGISSKTAVNPRLVQPRWSEGQLDARRSSGEDFGHGKVCPTDSRCRR
jgi:DNA-binding CsgD family transcriptional regulator